MRSSVPIQMVVLNRPEQISEEANTAGQLMRTELEQWHGLPVQGGYGCELLVGILECLYERLSWMLERCLWVRAVRLDLRYDEDESPGCFGNPEMQRFINSFGNHLRSIGCRFHYLWVREQDTGAPRHHYHIAVLLAPGCSYNEQEFCNRAGKYWTLALGLPEVRASGLVQVQRPLTVTGISQWSYVVRRDDRAAIEGCFYWLSSLCKAATKGCGPEYAKEFGYSRLQHDDGWLHMR